MLRRNNRGLSLIAALVAFVFVGLAAALLMNIFSGHSKVTGSLNNRMRGDQVLVATATTIQEMDYSTIRTLCTAYGALSAARTGICLAGNSLNPAATTYDPAKNPAQLEILRDWNGKPDNAGTACVEIAECKVRARARMIEVTLQGYWRDPSLQINSRRLTFRKSRW